jgi:hypothetical protein
MSEDRYQQLVRAGLAPFVEDVSDGPEWSDFELTTPSSRHTTSRVPGWVVALAAAAVVVSVFGLTSLLTPDGEPSTATATPSVTTTARDETPGAFVPPTRSAEGMTHLALTLLDGSHITLAFPEDLDLTSDGLEVSTVGSLEGTHSRVIGAHYGTPESFIAMMEESHERAELAASFPGITFPGGPEGVVELWEFPEEPIAYLVYDFDPWTVFVWDGMGGANSSMGEEALASWAANLWGETYAPGFLVLNAEPPLELVDAAEDPGPDAPDVRVDGSSGSLLVFINDCDRMNRLDEESYGNEVFAFCDEATNTLFFVGGDAEVQRRVQEQLLVNPPPPGLSDGEAPPLDQATGSHVYLSTDTQLTVVDIDAGSVTVHDLPELAPGDPLYRLIWRGDKLVFYGGTDVGPAVFTLDPATPTSPTLIDDDAWFFIPSSVDDRVWVAGLDVSSPETVRALDTVREVTVDGVVTTPHVAPPDGRWPVAAVDDGLVFQGDDVLEIWDPETQEFVDILPGPFPVAVWGNRIVACGACDQLDLIDLDADTARTIDVPVGVAFVDGYEGAFSPEGRYVAVPGWLTGGPLTAETRVALVLVDFESGTASVVPGIPPSLDDYSQVVWSTSGDWVFYSVGALAPDTGQLYAYRPGDDTAYRVPVVLDRPYYGMSAD